jgi:PAS domain S-box-containing protein
MTKERKAVPKTGSKEPPFEISDQALFQMVPIGLFRTTPQGRILDANPAFIQILGLKDREVVLNSNAADFYLDPKDREKVVKTLNKNKVLKNFEFRLKQADGRVIWAQNNVQAVFDPKTRGIYFEGSLLDITHRKQDEEDQKKRTQQTIRHQKALLTLAQTDLSDLKTALQIIAETDARTLDVERVSIWFFNADRSAIICRDLFQKNDESHEQGAVLRARDYPRYFRALQKSRIVEANDVLTDPRTNEFAEAYLKPLGISSMIDVPIRHRGQICGILCHEHVGPKRTWTPEEQQFAMSIGDTITVALETSERRRTARINASIFKIAEATNSAKNLDELFLSIHQVIADLMPAKNFYIALYDDLHDILLFPYFVDEFDPIPAPKKLGRGLTEYVLRTGRPLLASPEVFAELEKFGEVESIGAPSIDWLGVPLNIDGRTIGVLVVQTYTEGVRYGEEEKNILKFVCDQIAMAVHRRKTEDEVQERERFLSSVIDSIQDGISILDQDYRIIRVNGAMEKWYSHAMPLVGKKCHKAYHLCDTPCEVCPTRETIEKAQAAYRVVPKVGATGEVSGWLDLYSFPLFDRSTGRMKGVIEYVRDITERKMAEDRLQASLAEKEVLLREIHHRVKNNMQVISSLLNLQSRRISDPDVLEMFKESQRRIRSMALIHERLYQSSDLSRIEFSQYLRNLANHLFRSYQIDPDRIHVTIDADEIYLSINTAIPCALIVNELISNALKHGFPEERWGNVNVAFRRNDGNGCLLQVKDDGVGFPAGLDFHKTESLGMQIVVTLVNQIEGTIRLEREKGTSFQISFRDVN